MHHRCRVLVVAISAYQKHRISVVDERTSCAVDRIWWLVDSLWHPFRFSLSGSSSLTSVFTTVGSSIFVKLRKGTRALPGLETVNTYLCFGGSVPVEAVISVNLHFSDLFSSDRDIFSHDLRSNLFLNVFSISDRQWWNFSVSVQ